MNVYKLISGVVLILLVGMLIGSVGTWILVKPHRHPGPMNYRARTAEAVERLSRDLDLTPVQRVAVRKIMERMAERLHEHFVNHRPEMDKIIDESFAEVKAELNDEQKKKLDAVRERFRARRGGPKGPPPDGANRGDAPCNGPNCPHGDVR